MANAAKADRSKIRVSYSVCIAWIVGEDDTSEVTKDGDRSLATVTMSMVADVFNVDIERVWQDVLSMRKAYA